MLIIVDKETGELKCAADYSPSPSLLCLSCRQLSDQVSVMALIET